MAANRVSVSAKDYRESSRHSRATLFPLFEPRLSEMHNLINRVPVSRRAHYAEFLFGERVGRTGPAIRHAACNYKGRAIFDFEYLEVFFDGYQRQLWRGFWLVGKEHDEQTYLVIRFDFLERIAFYQCFELGEGSQNYGDLITQ